MDSPADEIRARLTAEQVARYYGLEPGRAGFIRCPFHQGDRTASLKLYPGNRGWHCFGCRRGGSVINFVMELFGVSFAQAVVRLDADFRLGLTDRRPSRGQRSAALEARRAEQREAEQRRAAYDRVAAEHLRLYEARRTLAPTRTDWERGSIHPLYVEALRRLPGLEDWLEENLMR